MSTRNLPKRPADREAELFAAFDSWRNVLTGMGTVKDKLDASEVQATIKGQNFGEIFLRASATARKVCYKWPEEMFREGFSVNIPGDAQKSKKQQNSLNARLDELDAAEHFEKAIGYSNAFGGGAVLFCVEERGNPSWDKPLDLTRLVKFNGLASITPREAKPVEYERSSGTHPRYGLPILYEVRREGDHQISDPMIVHYSRMAIFRGIRVANRMEHVAHEGWGDSLLNAIGNTLRDFEVGSHSMATLITNFTQLVMKVEGLAGMMGQNSKKVQTRVEQLNAGLSLLKMFILDANEDVKRETVNLTGAPDLLDRLAARIAMEADLPKSILLGESETGLNNDGSSTVRFFYDRVKSKQKAVAKQIKQLIKALFFCTDELEGNGEPDDWRLVFTNLWQPTAKEESEIYVANTQADATNIELGVLHVQEIRDSRYKSGEEYGTRIQIDPEMEADLEALNAATDPNAEDTQQSEDPPTDGITPPATGENKLQDRVLNGGQITALQGIVEAVAGEQIPRESGIAMIKVSLQIEDADAEEILADAGKGFKPKEEPPPVVVAPGAKPNAAPNKAASPKSAQGTKKQGQTKAPAKTVPTR